MRRTILWFAWIAGCVAFCGAGLAKTEPARLWVFFDGRPYLKSGKLPSPQWAGFTASAVRRREARGITSWNASDFPVDPRYVRALRSAGAEILNESRWLNAVSVRCDSLCRARLSSFSFIAEIRGVATFRRALERVDPVLTMAPAAERSENGLQLNYGNSASQLAQLKVPVAHQKGFAGQGEIVAIFDSGFMKDHVAFKNHVIVAERDYVFGDNNVSDGPETDSHGTSTWSCVGGSAPGSLYGPAYQAKFILAVTEDIRSETKVEEDNWVAALEWADRHGATVISSSLGYTDWYQTSDFNGTTPLTSRVASTAARKGIVVVNSAGNSGPGASTLGAPADARNILAVGAVSTGGIIAGFSSRGPTADGRLKPEVVARGVFTWVASDFNPTAFGRSSGTSFSCPLVAGFSAVLLSAHPDWTPLQVREAVMMTASRKNSPDNTYGYGIPNMALALEYLPLGSVVIDHKPLKNTSNASQPSKVVARIRAQRGLNLNQLFLSWKRDGAASFTNVLLKPVPGARELFEAFIPAQPHGTSILYFLSAKDIRGKTSRTPFGAPRDLYHFVIQ